MFHPSYIRDDLYEIADKHCVAHDTYRRSIIKDVVEYFDNKKPNIQSDWYEYTFEDYGVFYVAWIENGQLFTEAFAWRL